MADTIREAEKSRNIDNDADSKAREVLRLSRGSRDLGVDEFDGKSAQKMHEDGKEHSGC